MAHEVPLQVHKTNTVPAKPKKPKPVHQQLKLPNGKKPEFGPAQRDKSAGKPQLPNGEKPNFGGADHKQLGGKKKKQGKKNAANNANTEKNSQAEKPSATEKKTNLEKGSDSYAGSSFHSSPEALALPKPSFASTSPDVRTGPGPMSPQGSPSLYVPARNVQNMPPAFVYQGMPPAEPPRYPVTAYPPSAAQGFAYNANPQGFINYVSPPAAVPQPPLPMQMYPFQAYPPMGAPPPRGQPQGQRITFNELMGSSK